MKKMILALVALVGLTISAGADFANAQSLSHNAPPQQGQQQSD